MPDRPTNPDFPYADWLAAGQVAQVIQACEQALADRRDRPLLAAYLGVAYLLAGREDDAQAVWISTYAELQTEPEQADIWLGQLVALLNAEATRQTQQQRYTLAWALRQYSQEFAPDQLENLARLALLCLPTQQADQFADILATLTELVGQAAIAQVRTQIDTLLEVLTLCLRLRPMTPLEIGLAYLETLARGLQFQNLVQFKRVIMTLVHEGQLWLKALPPAQHDTLTRRLLPWADGHLDLLINLANLYQDAGWYQESLVFTDRVLALPHAPVDEIAVYYLQLRGCLQAGGRWADVMAASDRYQTAVRTLLANPPDYLDPFHLTQLLPSTGNLPYLKDDPADMHRFRQQVIKFCQTRFLATSALNLPPRSLPPLENRRPRIGYISTCLRRHSVGWISRWLFRHHDRQNFDIYIYSLRVTHDGVEEQIRAQVSQFGDVSALSVADIARQIYADELDILVDLDSLTSAKVCSVMMLKPAPIQVTWLGFDASGIPAIDYFLADDYVVPADAADYYPHPIWRLPQTYVAVDGFEVGIPTLRRADLDIPDEGVLFFTSQTASKRHPDSVSAQLEIIRQVPHAYLLIKGFGDQAALRDFFIQMAQAQDVDPERLRFLPLVAQEAVHRANLGMVDVVLDTFPYNGATTTLETLWMGVPLVTQVGEQFAARNSYTMLMNVGVTEGIAWSRPEYIEWGVKLGTDPMLRQTIAAKLRRSRHDAPLWNTREFARQLEAAYCQMIAHHHAALGQPST